VKIGESFPVSKILPHLGFQCSVKPFNDTGFRFLVLGGEEMNVVLSQKLLEDSVGKFYSFVGLQTDGVSTRLEDGGKSGYPGFSRLVFQRNHT
jgi:hypothetical protein